MSNGSCNGDGACAAALDFSAGPGSCNGEEACTLAGQDGGFANVGAGSCNGQSACLTLAQVRGFAIVRAGSCNGFHSCQALGRDDGSATVGEGSCRGSVACFEAGLGGSAVIGTGSCNGAGGCLRLGSDGGTATVGMYSCNAPDLDPGENDDPDVTLQCSGAGPGAMQTYGNCVENVIPLEACPASVSVTYGDPAPVLPGWCSADYTPKTPVSASPVKIMCGGTEVGALTILPAILTVTPNDQTWDLAGPQPQYTYRVEGWKNGESAATAAGYVAPVCGPARSTAITAAGLYNLVCRGGSAANYTFLHEGGVLTVTGSVPAPAPSPVPTTGVPAPTQPPATPTSVSPAATPTQPAPAPPNTGTGTGGSSAGWLLLFGALAMAAGGAAVWGRSRR